MPGFTYIARDLSGERISGKIEAANQREALSALTKRALFPIEIQADAASLNGQRVRRVPAQLMATTYGQLADLLGSGVPLLRALTVLQEQASHRGLVAALEQVRSRVEDGATLAEAMARFPRVFSEMAVNMVRAGGEGGFLEEALGRVAAFTEAQDDLRKRTLGAIAYPAFLCIVGVIVVTVLIVFFVPKFDELFARLRERGELPALTDWLLAFSSTLQAYGIYILLALGVAGVFAWRQLQTDAGRLWRDRVKLRIPLAGRIFRDLAVARFCRVLGTLLRNGVPILRSLDIARGATGNLVLAAAVEKATENITAGESLAKPLAVSGHFPPMVVEMIGVAEEANTLETVLVQIAESVERRTWRLLELGVRLLEPVMLLMLAGMVLVVVIALLLPVLKMSTTL